MKRLLLIILSFALAMNIHAGNVLDYSFGKENSVMKSWGTSKAETYDVAIRVVDSYLVGKYITSVSVPFDVTNATDVKVWLSTELKLKTIQGGKKVNDADIMTIDTKVENGRITAILPERYALPSEGVYVGYSFTLSDYEGESAHPVKVYTETSENGLYVHTSRTHRSWVALSESQNLVSSMKVTFEDDFANNAAALKIHKKLHGVRKSNMTLNAILFNKGKTEINSVDYSYELNGLKFNNRYVLPQPLSAKYNSMVEVNLPLEPFDFIGKYDMKIGITKVNGIDFASPTVESIAVGLYEFMPVHRPVIENYMAVWLGDSPRAIASVDMMKEKYPDFVSYTYHSLDAMHFMAEDFYPNPISQTKPTTWIDRRYVTDVYSGSATDKTEFGFEKDWKLMVDSFAQADVKVEGVLTKSYSECVDVIATIRFADADKSKTYNVEFILVADGLKGSGDDWELWNYYSMDKQYESSPGMANFVHDQEYIKGYVFNDIAVATSRLSPNYPGCVVEIPAEAENNVEYRTSFKFNLDECFCTYGTNLGNRLVQDNDKLNVVALLIENETGRVVNSHKAKVSSSTVGISSIVDDTKVEKTEYYSISGIKLEKPTHGVVLKKTLKNGKVEVKKLILP